MKESKSLNHDPFPVAPEFKTKFHTNMVRKDEDVKLTCEVKGDQPIQIQWHKDKLPLLGLASSETGMSTKVRDVPIAEGTKSELTLSRVGRKDSALYSCVATNKYGTDDTNIQLIVQGELLSEIGQHSLSYSIIVR